MVDYLMELCSDQKLANTHYQLLSKHSVDTSGVMEGTVLADISAEGNIERTIANNKVTETVEPSDILQSTKATTYGVIYTGEPKHFRQIHQSIISLILSNSSQSIPTVEVWVNHYALPRCKRVFNSFTFVNCKMFTGNIDVQTHTRTQQVQSIDKPATSRKATEPIVITGFEAKLHALLQTTLQHVLFLDADNIVTRDVSEVFSNPGYLRTGNYFNINF